MFVVLGKREAPMSGRVSRLVGRVVLPLLIFAVVACGAAGGVAPTAFNPGPATLPTTAPSQHPRAEAELATLLAGVRVPAGAQPVTTAPVAFLAEAPATEGSVNFLIRTSWWRIDMSFADTLDWIRTHPPEGLQSDRSGTAGGPGVPANESLGYPAPSTTAYDGALVELEAAAMGSSQTGLRADAEVIWLPPRPSEETLPFNAAVTLVAINHFGSSEATTLRTRRLDPGDAAILISDLNTLLPDDGGTRGCAADTGYRVQIEASIGGPPILFSYWPACWQIDVTRGGTSLVTLAPTGAYQDEITRLIGPQPTS